MYKSIAKLTLLISLVASSCANASPIGPLERERARTLNLILDKTISIAERKKKLEKSKMKLLDLERMTINNKQINKNPDTHTIRAFEDFDLTFLVHNSFEKNKPLSVTWFEKMGLTTDNIMNTRVSRR
jgi:hypothetical protein